MHKEVFERLQYQLFSLNSKSYPAVQEDKNGTNLTCELRMRWDRYEAHSLELFLRRKWFNCFYYCSFDFCFSLVAECSSRKRPFAAEHRNTKRYTEYSVHVKFISFQHENTFTHKHPRIKSQVSCSIYV